jgi:maleylpyruvate isomerase
MIATVDSVAAVTAHLLATAQTLDGAAMRRPSLLPGWTVGHVLSHVALNAEAFARVAADLRAGRPGLMYPAGMAARDADIEAAAGRSANRIVSHLHDSAAAFDAAWRDAPPPGRFATAPGFPEAPGEEVPGRRLREVAVHAADTGLEPLAYATWPEEYVASDLALQWATVARRCEGPVHAVDETGRAWRIGEGGEPVTVDRRTLLAWLLDRTNVTGLPALLSWGDQSQWLAPR